MKKIAAALIMLAAPCAAQTTVPGQPIVPLSFWEARAAYDACPTPLHGEIGVAAFGGQTVPRFRFSGETVHDPQRHFVAVVITMQSAFALLPSQIA
jgi:hypothetical protein